MPWSKLLWSMVLLGFRGIPLKETNHFWGYLYFRGFGALLRTTQILCMEVWLGLHSKCPIQANDPWLQTSLCKASPVNLQCWVLKSSSSSSQHVRCVLRMRLGGGSLFFGEHEGCGGQKITLPQSTDSQLGLEGRLIERLNSLDAHLESKCRGNPIGRTPVLGIALGRGQALDLFSSKCFCSTLWDWPMLSQDPKRVTLCL